MTTPRGLDRPTIVIFGIALAGLIIFSTATGNWGLLIALPVFAWAAVLLVLAGQRR